MFVVCSECIDMNILFMNFRFYSVATDKLNWENQLYLATSKRWSHARNEIHQCLQIKYVFVCLFILSYSCY